MVHGLLTSKIGELHKMLLKSKHFAGLELQSDKSHMIFTWKISCDEHDVPV